MKYRKKSFKIIIIMTIIVLINIFIFSYIPVNAVIYANMLDEPRDNAEEIKPFLAGVLEITGIIASAASIVTLIILGIKYMLGSVEEKAEYKKTLLPYFLGAIFVFGASTIASFIYSIFN